MKTINYAELHFVWYIPFLKEEYGDLVEAWTASQISRKFTNTLNDIWQRQLRDRISNDEKARAVIARMIELMEEGTEFYIML